MPIYEYHCDDCERTIEIFQKITEGHKRKCPECGGRIRRLISHTSFQLKGSGWYVTDYAGGKNGNGSSHSESPAAETKPAESKPESTDSAAAKSGNGKNGSNGKNGKGDKAEAKTSSSTSASTSSS